MVSGFSVYQKFFELQGRSSSLLGCNSLSFALCKVGNGYGRSAICTCVVYDVGRIGNMYGFAEKCRSN